MTQAAICDRCGRILPEGRGAYSLAYRNPLTVDGEKRFDLCHECFDKFRYEYLENLEQEGGGV